MLFYSIYIYTVYTIHLYTQYTVTIPVYYRNADLTEACP